MRKNCKNFEEWAKSQVDEFTAIKKKSKHLQIVHSVDRNSARYMICNLRNGKTGYETVKMKNFVNDTIVVGLAWANYKGEKIPDFKVPLCRLTTNDKFIYKEKEYRYLTSNPYTKDHIIICDYSGTPSNLHKLTRVTPC